MVYRQLLQLYLSLRALNYNDKTKPDGEKVLISGDTAAKRKAKQMVELIEKLLFWHNIAL